MKIENRKYKTFPIIVHAPGWTYAHKFSKSSKVHDKINPLWKPIFQKWNKSKLKGIPKKKSKKLTILTWSNSKEKGLMEKSLEILGYKCIVLKKDSKEWKNIYKIDMMAKVVDSIKTPYVMALDDYDILVLRNPEKAIEKFNKMDCEMLFNGEKYFYPEIMKDDKSSCIIEEWMKFQKKVAKSQFAFLNSGAWIAKTSFFKKFIEECKQRSLDSLVKQGKLRKNNYISYQKIVDSDQVLTHWIFQDYYPKIKIDYRTEIFLNIAGLSLLNRKIKLYRKFYEIPFSEWKQYIIEFLKIIKEVKKK